MNNYSRGPVQQGQPPVSIGEELDVRIDSVGEKGDGIARKKGFILFVPNSKAGDYVKIRVTKVLAKVGFAEVVTRLEGPPPGTESPRPRPRPAQPEEDASLFDSSKDSENFGDEELPTP